MLAEQVVTQKTVRVWFESHSIVSWLLIGLIAGWLAGKIARGRGFGCIADIVLGLVGSFIGGWGFVKLGIFCGGFWVFLPPAALRGVLLGFVALLFARGFHPLGPGD